jgi:hypothetical protein
MTKDEALKMANNQTILELIEKHKGERTFFDGELVGAFFTIGHLERLVNEAIKENLMTEQKPVVSWEEGLILQLPITHDGRNSWLLNHGKDLQAEWLRNNHAKLQELSSVEHTDYLTKSLQSIVDKSTCPNKPLAEQPAPIIELKPANIAKARWAWGIPSKDGEAVFNANGDGFLAGWLACEEWINKEKNT